jgi:selenide,water dikinase
MKRLLLVGGGHSHIEVLRRFAAAPVPAADIALVTPDRHLIYTGMLPGLIAGHYGRADCRIDLEELCREARVRFVQAEGVALDLARNELRCDRGAALGFDLLSLDVGATPRSAPGDAARSVPVKPFTALLAGWDRMLAAARAAAQEIAIVGGGAGGIELALAMDHRLRAAGATGSRIAVVTESALLPGHPAAARRIFERLLARRGIALHCGSRVASHAAGVLCLESGARLPAGWTVWATSAAAAAWLPASGLATDPRGFVSVDRALRSVSHAHVFAAGDCANMIGYSLPKSGVHAVRQAPPLAANLRNTLGGAPLIRHSPQRRALALISTGSRHAVASWGGVAFGGAWVWRWKDGIDRRFVAKYRLKHAGGQGA